MSILQKLELNQVQNLRLTPELIQSITILQLNKLELESYIYEELLSNPLLEINEEIETERVYDVLSHRYGINIRPDEGDDNELEETTQAQLSLFDFLTMQFHMVSGLTKKQEKIGEYIIDSLDDNGYRTERATEIAAKLNCSHDEVIDIIKIIQDLEPPGVAAKSLEESLILQLKRLGEYDEIFDEIVNNHLEDIASNRMPYIANACGIEVDLAQEYCDIIRGLNPKPGKLYGKCNDSYIVPDCYLEIVGGKMVVTINEDSSPALKISPYCSRLKKEALNDPETLAYLEERLNSAMWLIKGIEHRKENIRNIAESIVEFQKDFFEKGKRFLRPMTLSDIADQVGVHESTVSRTINGKYIQTPRGLFELKYFFSGGYVSDAGEYIAKDNIREYIKQIINTEDPSDPYIDEKIKEILSQKYGVEIARRTISKYREQLNIPGAANRKRF